MVRAVFIGLVISAALICPLSAQRGGGGGRGGGMGGGGGFPGMQQQPVNKAQQVAKELKIEDKQSDVEAIFNETQKKYTAIMNPTLAQAFQQMLNVDLKGGDPKDLQIQAAGLEAQLTTLEAEALAKVLALAEAKQKSKAAKVFAMMSGMFDKGDWRNRP